MKKLLVILVGIAILYTGCKSDSDILATFKDGKVTRGELRSYIKSRRMKEKIVMKRKSQQRRLIKKIALEKILFKKALAHMSKDKDFKYAADSQKSNSLARFLMKRIYKSGKFKDEIAKVKIIKLLVKYYKVQNKKRVRLKKPAIEVEAKKTIAKAKEVIAELKKGSTFASLVKKYSKDFSKRKGGDIGWVVKGTRGKAFSKAAFALKKGEISKEPVRVGNNVYIIKLVDKRTVTESNLESVIGDEKKAKRYKRRLARLSMRSFPKKLAESKTVTHNIDNYFKPGDLVVYKIDNKEFKKSDVQKFINLITKRRRQMNRKFKLSKKRQKRLVTQIMHMKLLAKEAVKQGLDKKPEYLSLWRRSLTSTYKREAMFKDIKVTDVEVVKEYNKNKKRYTRRKKIGKKKYKRIQLPLDQRLKRRIKFSLERRKRMRIRRKLERDLLRKSSYKVDNKQLEGK